VLACFGLEERNERDPEAHGDSCLRHRRLLAACARGRGSNSRPAPHPSQRPYRPTIAVHRGRIVKRTGDGGVVEFRSVVDAVRCAIEVQSGLAESNAGLPPEKRIEFRVGIHVGDVVEESDGDLMGDGVNIAARLEGICEPSEIVLSGTAYEHARDRLKEAFVDLGEKALKNIARPVRVYTLKLAGAAPASPAVAEKSSPPHLSIVVLPFANLAGDAEQNYFVDGVTESLTTDLSQMSGMLVIGRNTAFSYKSPFENAYS
jgi:adenylate cyclase